jgi:type I restriction enzyme S subunit
MADDVHGGTNVAGAWMRRSDLGRIGGDAVSWPLVKLEDFCKTSSGGTPSRKVVEYYDGDIPWVKSGDLRESIVTEVSEHITQLAIEKSSAKIVPAGAILLAMYGATVGRMAWLGIDAATNQAVCSIIPDKSKAFPKYVYYALLSKVPHFLNEAVGGAQPNISQGLIRETEIPLPPLAEQKRIAAILDKADAIRRKRQQAIQLADDFLRAVFLDMFGDPVTNPKGFEVSRIEEISFRVTKGESPKWQGFDYGSNGVRFITSENVLWGKLDNRVKYIPIEFHEKLKRSKIRDGDLLINLVGASVGRACLAFNNGLPANINQAVAVTTLNTERIFPKIALCQLLLPSVQRSLLGNVVDAARANISLKNIRDLQVIIPPIDLQRKFIQISNKFDFITIKKEQTDNMNLFQSLSQKAFRGEL